MRNIVITAIASIILIACSSNPITPKIEEQLRNQLTKNLLSQEVDSAYQVLYQEGFSSYYDEAVNGVWGPLVQYANRLGRFSGMNTDSLWESEYQKTDYCKSLLSNYQTTKSLINDYLSNWVYSFTNDDQNYQPSIDQVLESGIKNDGFQGDINDRVLRFIYYNRVPKPKLHFEEELEDNYFKVLDMNSNKRYILHIENDSLYSFTNAN